MDDTVRKITAEDINPRYNWARALPALDGLGPAIGDRLRRAAAGRVVRCS